MITLVRVFEAIDNLVVADGDKKEARDCLATAINALKDSLDSMDKLQVCNRNNVDTLLGCMMAVEQIIGEGENNG